MIPRANITARKNQGLSLMPEGLEAGLTPQAPSDLTDSGEACFRSLPDRPAEICAFIFDAASRCSRLDLKLN